jgi:hypothetical protein
MATIELNPKWKRDLNETDSSNPAFVNPAIARCMEAWEKVRGCWVEHGETEDDAAAHAGKAYRASLPPLTSRDNCRDFVACVAHGILLGAIDDKDAGKLLYAAQVAIVAASADEKSRERAGYAIYADLSETEMKHVKKFMPKKRTN